MRREEVCARVCVWGGRSKTRDRDRERKRDRDRQRQRERERETVRHRQSQSQRERYLVQVGRPGAGAQIEIAQLVRVPEQHTSGESSVLTDQLSGSGQSAKTGVSSRTWG